MRTLILFGIMSMVTFASLSQSKEETQARIDALKKYSDCVSTFSEENKSCGGKGTDLTFINNCDYPVDVMIIWKLPLKPGRTKKFSARLNGGLKSKEKSVFWNCDNEGYIKLVRPTGSPLKFPNEDHLNQFGLP